MHGIGGENRSSPFAPRYSHLPAPGSLLATTSVLLSHRRAPQNFSGVTRRVCAGEAQRDQAARPRFFRSFEIAVRRTPRATAAQTGSAGNARTLAKQLKASPSPEQQIASWSQSCRKPLGFSRSRKARAIISVRARSAFVFAMASASPLALWTGAATSRLTKQSAPGSARGRQPRFTFWRPAHRMSVKPYRRAAESPMLPCRLLSATPPNAITAAHAGPRNNRISHWFPCARTSPCARATPS